ncbi:hypothetical protein KP509_29G071300 [Ceratopteris richardii]|nr:hypothetical protein KP509_29G071300 [Ceratopteris richardii]KAH7292502.1 hypothetical protein KP509_29G071300 [Ceratopteris richardii]
MLKVYAFETSFSLRKLHRLSSHAAIVLLFMYLGTHTVRTAAEEENTAASLNREAQSQRLVVDLQEKDQRLVPAFFVFGDSLVDDGNNNYIPSLARSNFYPYGIDFPLGATGRFCNGRTVVDLIGQFLGLPFLPAYLNPKTQGSAILSGVNYASAAGGILDSSGRNYVARLSFNQQIENFKNSRQQYVELLGGEEATSEFLSKSIFAIVFGSNDYLNNYLINSTGLSQEYTPDAYRVMVADMFAEQLVTLYGLGARRFIVTGVGPLGCIPNVLATKSKDGHCVQYVNQLVQGFNAEVLQLVNELNSDPRFADGKFLYANVYNTFSAIVADPAKYGMKVLNEGCCGVGRNRGVLTCLPPLAKLCTDRGDHLFWDAFHPTEATNLILASGIIDGDSSLIVPMNLRQLVSQG